MSPRYEEIEHLPVKRTYRAPLLCTPRISTSAVQPLTVKPYARPLCLRGVATLEEYRLSRSIGRNGRTQRCITRIIII